MPVYEYKCRGCENIFDRFLSISRKDEPKSQPCPTCGKEEVQENISTSALRFMDVKPSEEFGALLNRINDMGKPKVPLK